ncbi:MAG: hypothetical protein QM617_09065 [Comamonas sp.]
METTDWLRQISGPLLGLGASIASGFVGYLFGRRQARDSRRAQVAMQTRQAIARIILALPQTLPDWDAGLNDLQEHLQAMQLALAAYRPYVRRRRYDSLQRLAETLSEKIRAVPSGRMDQAAGVLYGGYSYAAVRQEIISSAHSMQDLISDL